MREAEVEAEVEVEVEVEMRRVLVLVLVLVAEVKARVFMPCRDMGMDRAVFTGGWRERAMARVMRMVMVIWIWI